MFETDPARMIINPITNQLLDCLAKRWGWSRCPPKPVEGTLENHISTISVRRLSFWWTWWRS